MTIAPGRGLGPGFPDPAAILAAGTRDRVSYPVFN